MHHKIHPLLPCTESHADGGMAAKWIDGANTPNLHAAHSHSDDGPHIQLRPIQPS